MAIPFQLPRLYPVLDTSVLSGRSCLPVSAAQSLIEAGVRILQYRHKDHWTQAQFDEAKQIASLCEEAGVLYVLNDRADFARLMGAALHVGQEDLPPVAARSIVGDEPMGFSTHNRGQLVRANSEPVEYLSIGPVFPTTSKLRPDPVIGIDGIKALRPLTSKPLVAIGGIDRATARDVIDAGADSIAIISAIFPEGFDHLSLRRHTEEWLQLLAA